MNGSVKSRAGATVGAWSRGVAGRVLVLGAVGVLLVGACRFNLTVHGPTVDRHGDSRATASQVDASSKTAGYLGNRDVDYFLVRVERLSYLQVETTGVTDTAAELQDWRGRRFADDDDSGSGTNFAIGHRLGRGDYYVRVSTGAGGETGAYELLLRRADVDEHGGSRSTATFVAVDSRIRGYLRVGDVDYFKTVVDEERVLSVFSTGFTDTAAVLENAYGRVLDADDDGGVGTNFRIRERVRPGIYYVRVQEYRYFADGEYYLYVE